MELAARLNDPVAHAGKLGGGLLGAAIGGIVVVAVVAAYVITAPVSIPATAVVVIGGSAVASGLTTGYSFGKTFLSKPFKSQGSHDIITGARTVRVGDTLEKAARMSDKVKCHSGKAIDVGSLTVIIEGWNAARKGDLTECAGKISDGCHTVMIGGPQVARSGSGKRSETAGAADDTFFAIDIIGSILGLWGPTEVKVGARVLWTGLKYGSGLKQNVKYAEIGLKVVDRYASGKTTAVVGDGLKATKLIIDRKSLLKTSVDGTKNALSVIGGGSKTVSAFSSSGDSIATYDDVVAAKAKPGP